MFLGLPLGHFACYRRILRPEASFADALASGRVQSLSPAYQQGNEDYSAALTAQTAAAS
jgi:hypothetical protein